MKRTRLRYDRAFKISVVAELESGKPLAQIAREHSIHPSLQEKTSFCPWLKSAEQFEMEVALNTVAYLTLYIRVQSKVRLKVILGRFLCSTY